MVLSMMGPSGPAFTAIPGTGGGGVGDGATAACSTGLPLGVAAGATATGAAAAGADFAPCIALIFAFSSAFSLSILSSRAMTSSSVAARDDPPNAIKQSVAQAVPDRSLLFMACSPV